MTTPSSHAAPDRSDWPSSALGRDFDAETVVRDHDLRSRYLRHLACALSKPTESAPTAPVPRVIVQFWDDQDRIPIDVLECMETWATLEGQGFRREVYGNDSARSFIEANYGNAQVTAFNACPHPAMRSDYFRLCYLACNGGFYIDADDTYQGSDWSPLFRDSRLRLQALCYDTATDSMVDPLAAISRDVGSNTWIHYVNNNPIIAPAGHPVVVEALKASTSAILNHSGGPMDIQAMTGPGNLTVALTRYSLSKERLGQQPDVEILNTWDTFAMSRWPLSYRDDERNWRLWRQEK
jgi:mannosyltransferase OCH1-like enzyme